VDVPVIIVEVKSPDDTLDDIIHRSFDYEGFKVRHILMMDPERNALGLFIRGVGNFLPAAA
jgi:hypothetical protein